MTSKASNFGCSVNAARPPRVPSASSSMGSQVNGGTRAPCNSWRSSHPIFWPCPFQITSATPSTRAKNAPRIQRTPVQRKEPNTFSQKVKMDHSFKKPFSVFLGIVRQTPAVWGAYTLTLGKIWAGSGSTSQQATTPITAWAPAPTSGMPKTNILRFKTTHVWWLLINLSLNLVFGWFSRFLTIVFKRKLCHYVWIVVTVA